MRKTRTCSSVAKSTISSARSAGGHSEKISFSEVKSRSLMKARISGPSNWPIMRRFYSKPQHGATFLFREEFTSNPKPPVKQLYARRREQATQNRRVFLKCNFDEFCERSDRVLRAIAAAPP